MRRLTSLTEMDWITDNLAPSVPGMGCSVAECVPSNFEAYAKLFHPIFEGLDTNDDGLTWQQAEPFIPDPAGDPLKKP